MAFKRVIIDYPEAKLMIYGEGPEKKQLLKIIQNNHLEHNVLLPGKTEEAMRHAVYSSFYVMSSRYEGFSNALFEIMSYGVPVLATIEKTGVAEIPNFEQYGMIIPQLNAETLYKQLTVMIKLYKKFDSAKNIESIKQLTEQTQSLQQYLEFT